MKPDNIILEGVTGSVAYGLNTENSDVDIKGIYLVPTENVLSFGWNMKHSTKDHTDPDWVYHEVQKFMSLAMVCNPTITELLWLEDYTKLTPIGQLLIDNRELFLSNIVFDAYGGYALSQARDLNRRGGTYANGRNKRFEKHTRHCFRLLLQGRELLETGKLTVRVTPEQREELFAIGKLSPEEVIKRFTEEFEGFKRDSKNRIKSVLPDKPDKERLNELLLKIRKMNYDTASV